MKSYILKSKKIDSKITQNDIKNSQKVGNYYSGDRFYSLLNEYIDKNLSRKSRTLGFIVKYLFTSGNYKHNTSISNGKSFGLVLVDIIAVLSMIGFFGMLIGVVGLSIKSIPTDIGGIVGFGKGFIDSISGNIPMLVFAILFFVITVLWLVMFFKIRKKNKALSLKDYLTKKIEFILKLRWLIKTKQKTVGKIAKGKDISIFYLEKFETQGGSDSRWLNIQLINLLASIFDDFNLVFKFNEMSDDEYNELNKIIDYDFKKIEIIRIK